MKGKGHYDVRALGPCLLDVRFCCSLRKPSNVVAFSTGIRKGSTCYNAA